MLPNAVHVADAGEQDHALLGADAGARRGWAARGTRRSTSRTSWRSASRARDDDFVFAPGTTVAEYAHPETGIIYRAPANTGGARANIGKEIIDELIVLTGTPGTRGDDPAVVRQLLRRYAGCPTGTRPRRPWTTRRRRAIRPAYSNALSTFNFIKQLLAYRVDLVSDIRPSARLLLLPIADVRRHPVRQRRCPGRHRAPLLPRQPGGAGRCRHRPGPAAYVELLPARGDGVPGTSPRRAG